MRLFIDTNIIVDIISKREGYEDSLRILKYCEIRQVNGVVSAMTVTDVMYILRKHIAPEAVRDTVQTLLLIVDVADVLKSDISSAFSSGIKDFEDAVQASCSLRIKADYIVTRNLKDFERAAVPAISPTAALELIKK